METIREDAEDKERGSKTRNREENRARGQRKEWVVAVRKPKEAVGRKQIIK